MAMNKSIIIPPNNSNVTARYKRPIIDRMLGKTTLEWKCENGTQQQLQANLRFTDYEGNFPSWYSVSKLPYIITTYFQKRKSPIIKKPIPFLVIDAVHHLNNIIRPGMKVLELGAGNSTLWFLEQGAHLTTYENDTSWCYLINKHIKSKPEYYYAGKLSLRQLSGIDVINDLQRLHNYTYDIVLIDSLNAHTNRNDCMQAVLNKIKPGGWLILDNSDNPINWKGADLVKDKLHFKYTGYTPMSLFVCQTSFWKF